MPDTISRNLDSEIRACQECGELSVHVSLQDQDVVYGSGDDQTTLRAEVPVWTCEACGEQYTDGEAEEIRHETICRHLGRLTPSELRLLRKRNGLTQAELADVTGLGIASVKRWETGNLIQSVSNDRFLRLLRNPAVVSELRQISRDRLSSAEIIYPVFRTAIRQDVYVAAAAFELRKPIRAQ